MNLIPEENIRLIAGLFHVGLCDDAIGPVIGNNVEHRNAVACRRPEGGVRVVDGTIADETDDRFVRSTERVLPLGLRFLWLRTQGGSSALPVLNYGNYTFRARRDRFIANKSSFRQLLT